MINRITRESMDMIVEEIMNVMSADWLTEGSKPMEIERVLVDNGLAVVVEEQKNNKMYKLRIYKKSGHDRGNLDHEEMFDTKEEMNKRYDELFDVESYSLNPTAWELVNGKWLRLMEY